LHQFAESLPPGAREDVHNWLYDYGEVCEGVYNGKAPGTWYAVTASGFRVYNSGRVVRN
jgi:hypothetical protein